MVDGLVPICRQFKAPRGLSDRQNRPIGGVMRPGEGRGLEAIGTSAESAHRQGYDPREGGGKSRADPVDLPTV